MSPKKIVILASGNGSNAENLAHYFEKSAVARVAGILTNNPKAGVIDRALRLQIPFIAFNKYAGREAGFLQSLLHFFKPDLIVLAGYLSMIPDEIIKTYPGKIINLHPALLPRFGGKGMYGDHVHRAVLSAGEKESGITIHYVNEEYDKGEIIFQAATPVFEADTPDLLAARIHQLEYKHFPVIVEQILTEN